MVQQGTEEGLPSPGEKYILVSGEGLKLGHRDRDHRKQTIHIICRAEFA